MDNCYPILLPSIGGTNACEKLAEYMGIKSELQQFIVLYFHYSDCHQKSSSSWNGPFRDTVDDLAVMRQSNRNPTIISTVAQKVTLTYLCVKDIICQTYCQSAALVNSFNGSYYLQTARVRHAFGVLGNLGALSLLFHRVFSGSTIVELLLCVD